MWRSVSSPREWRCQHTSPTGRFGMYLWYMRKALVMCQGSATKALSGCCGAQLRSGFRRIGCNHTLPLWGLWAHSKAAELLPWDEKWGPNSSACHSKSSAHPCPHVPVAISSGIPKDTFLLPCVLMLLPDITTLLFFPTWTQTIHPG